MTRNSFPRHDKIPVPAAYLRKPVMSVFLVRDGPNSRDLRRPRRCSGKNPAKCSGENPTLGKSRGWWRGIGVESGVLYVSAARPKSDADDFVGVGFTSDDIGAGTLRRAAPGKTRRGKIETSPKEMYGAGLPDEFRSKFLQDGINGDKYPPERMGIS